MSILSRNRHSPDPEPSEPDPPPDPQAVERARLAAMPTRERVALARQDEETRRRLEKEHQERARQAENEALRDRQQVAHERKSNAQRAWAEKRDALSANLDTMRHALSEAQGRMWRRPGRGDFDEAKAAAIEVPGLELMVNEAQRALDFHMGQAPSFGHSF